ncbi:diacylglycerol/lipid kinase family protein [Furfurilactobacillus entadae]|uniref:diacylglycerol/lipid kinase family protein n=1 Tax=Furfurilactobacillus entadae TaxID=2922307 RepID=UPI0035E76737
MNRHFYIILNRHAGQGHAADVWTTIAAELARQSVDYTLAETEYAGHATLLAEQFAKHHQESTVTEVVLVVGGDGTLNQVLNGLQDAHSAHQLPIAYIPAGSGNDFARGAHISQEPLTALNQVLAASAPQSLDIGRYEETIKKERRYFVNNVGIGFDAAIVSAANHSTDKKTLNRMNMGNLAYLRQIFHVLGQQDSFPVTVHIGTRREIFPNGFLVTTSNHPYFGGGVPILPNATVKDGQLSLIVVEKLSWPRFAFLFSLIPTGRHLRFKAVHQYKAREIHLTVSALEFGQVDGEEMGTRFFDIYLMIDQYPFWFTETTAH